MILRWLVICIVAGFAAPAGAQERVMVVTQRLAANGALFIAAVNGYFTAEGLNLEMGAFHTTREVLDAVASGRAEFGLTELTSIAFNLAGKGAVRMIAAQAREWRDYEGNDVLASNAAYAKGLRKFEDLAGKIVAVESLGSAAHYQLGEIARAKGFDLTSVTVKPFYSVADAAKAVGTGTADAAILPAQNVAILLSASQARMIGWVSQFTEQQTGALFTSPTTIKTKRATVEKFVRAYRRGVADYSRALLRHDRFAKRISDSASREAAGMIARYVYPGQSTGMAVVEASAPFMDPKARIDINDIARQLGWYQAQGFVEKTVEARDLVDLSFTAGP
jgi:NitT/TauT family transport system substrate-binding protein